MKRTSCAMLVLAMLAVTIAGSTPAGAAMGGTDRPFKSTTSSSGQVDLTSGDFVLDGSTIGTHFGKGSIHTEGNLINVDFVSTITAANGDTLTSRFADFADPGLLVCPAGFDPFALTQSFTGGTGRFTDATGITFVLGCMSTNGTTFTVNISTVGTISY